MRQPSSQKQNVPEPLKEMLKSENMEVIDNSGEFEIAQKSHNMFRSLTPQMQSKGESRPTEEIRTAEVSMPNLVKDLEIAST